MQYIEERYKDELPIEDKIKGRYKLSKEDVLSEEGLLLVQCMIRDGMTLGDVAKALNITPATFIRWRKESRELREVCARGRQLVDYKVENALLKAALGYTTESVKTLISRDPKKDGSRTIRVEKTTTEVGPSVTACLAWLNNRKPEQWRKNRDNVLEYDDKNSGITINIVKGEKAESEQNSKDDDWSDVE